MQRREPLGVRFYRTDTGYEPVREWLRSLEKYEKKLIGEDIKAVQLGWPIGMPVVKKLDRGLWEVRTNLRDKISRVLFTFVEGNIVLLHGLIKKSWKVPREDMSLARSRLSEIEGGH